MDFVIGNIHIQVTKKGDIRLIYPDGDTVPAIMMWDKRAYKWYFSAGDVCEELKEHEMDISNAIIMTERTKPI